MKSETICRKVIPIIILILVILLLVYVSITFSTNDKLDVICIKIVHKNVEDNTYYASNEVIKWFESHGYIKGHACDLDHGYIYKQTKSEFIIKTENSCSIVEGYEPLYIILYNKNDNDKPIGDIFKGKIILDESPIGEKCYLKIKHN